MDSKGSVLVTGANSGIGWELTLRLLGEGWDVIALVRSAMGRHPIVDEALKEGRLRIYRGDLGKPESLDEVLGQILESERSIEVLFNNAGVAPENLAIGYRGYDQPFEVNTLAPYVVTKALLPLLRAGKRKTVVHTSSAAADTVKRFSTDLLLHPTQFSPFSGPYGRSKLALSLWTQAWAPALAAEGIRMLSADPGPNNTVMNNPWRKSAIPFWIRWIQRFINKPPYVGADLLYRAAFGDAEPGAFLSANKPKNLAFADQAEVVLSLVEDIAAEQFVLASQSEHSGAAIRRAGRY